MNRKTLMALVVFLVLLGLVVFLQSRPDKGERLGERPRPLARIDGKQIDTLSITHKGVKVVLKRALQKQNNESWALTLPVAYAADKYAADTAVEKLGGLEFGDLVTEQRARHAEYEVEGENALQVRAEGGGKVLCDLIFGKVMDDFTLMRVAGKDQVWQAVGALRYAFEREVKNWRDRTIIDFKQEDARTLKVSTPDSSIVLSRKDDKTSWTVESSTVAIDALDENTVTNVLSTMYSLQAFDFGDAETPEKAGLSPPRATVTVVLKDKKEHTLRIGSQKDENYWVQRPDKPQIWSLQKYSVENLLKRPIDFRNKTILSFKADDAVSLKLEKLQDKESAVLVRKDAQWQTEAGKKVEDEGKVKDAIEALSNLAAEGFAWNTAAELGLDKPQWQVTVTLKDRTAHTLQVGGIEKDGLYGLIRKGMPDIFTIRKYQIDRFLLEPKTYQ